MNNKEFYQEVFKEVKINRKKLDNCKGPHEFVPDPPSKMPTIGSRYRCTECGGTVDAIALSWYNKGIEHGRKK